MPASNSIWFLEIERILNRFKDNHSIYYAFLTAYYTGMRVSEVYALTWDCVDFEKKTITVNKNIIKKNNIKEITDEILFLNLIPP